MCYGFVGVNADTEPWTLFICNIRAELMGYLHLHGVKWPDNLSIFQTIGAFIITVWLQ